ncbi:MAG: HNH endonuclease [Elusimicrobia bacterium]|nr:HNH endonuclease [Elusimicrobiota bacterium]
MTDDKEDPMDECAGLTDADLIRAVKFLAEHARRNEMRLLIHLSEFDARRLCLEEGYRSLYEYCTGTLGFDEHESYRRIRAARILRSYPEARIALDRRKVTVSALVVLSPWLTRENAGPWLKSAEGKTKRELEALVAARYPQAEQPDSIRNLPARPIVVSSAPPAAFEALPPDAGAPGTPSVESGASSAGEENAPVEWVALAGAPGRLGWGWQQVAPVAVDRVRVGFDAASVVAQLIDRVRQILRHKYPEGRLEDLIREALEAYLDRKDPQRRLEMKAAKAECVAESPAPAPENDERLPTRFLRAWAAGRYIPAKVKSAVWARDEGRCAWREPDGTVCGSKDWIEYDHLRPYAKGGRSDDPRNIRLLCRTHNQAAAEAAFGRRASETGFSAGPASA